MTNNCISYNIYYQIIKFIYHKKLKNKLFEWTLFTYNII